MQMITVAPHSIGCSVVPDDGCEALELTSGRVHQQAEGKCTPLQGILGLALPSRKGQGQLPEQELLQPRLQDE